MLVKGVIGVGLPCGKMHFVHTDVGSSVRCCLHDQQHLGWGLLRHFPPFCYFPNFSALSKHPFVLEYHVYIWQVSPQLSCGDSWQIWMWLKESNSYFCKIENFAYGEINERSFSNPHPWSGSQLVCHSARCRSEIFFQEEWRFDGSPLMSNKLFSINMQITSFAWLFCKLLAKLLKLANR